MSSSAIVAPSGRVRSRGPSPRGALPTAPTQGPAKRVWPRAAGYGAVVLALFAGADALHRWSLASPYFRVKAIRVSGTAHLSRSVVRARLGLRETDNLLAVDLDTLRRRIESHPWVRSVSLSRDLPGTLRVEVVERKPWATLAPQGKTGGHLIDEEGVILAEAGAGREGLPVLQGLNVGGAPETLRAGRSLSGRALETGLAAVRAYLAVWPGDRNGGVRLAALDLSGYPVKGRISMNLLGPRGRTVWVRLSPRDMEPGLRRFAFLMTHRRGKSWPGEVDLSMGSRVVVRSSARRPERTGK